jgi:2-alkyl-3-oxoalkanoate reductase
MIRVAVLGASGFIGSRLCEMMHLGAMAEMRPVVRTPSGMALLSRLRIEGRVADALDERALTSAFEGCDVVVHAVAGSPDLITGSLAPVYNAAQQAGARRLVYLSTASVHGQSPAPGTTEESPIAGQQPIPYNNAKVRAEQMLRRLRQRGTVELIMLRPGIVFGPRSYWVGSFAEALLSGQAYQMAHGRGICNSLYVDNLVHAIFLALSAPGVDGEAFLIGDQETVTWADLYRPIAEFLGFNFHKLPHAHAVTATRGKQRQHSPARSSAFRTLASRLPPHLRKAISTAIAPVSRPPPNSPWDPKPTSNIEATLEMSLLYQCQYKFPTDKAKRLLGYDPPVTFLEGCRRTVDWLKFAAYDSRRSNPTADGGIPVE